jgi:DnaK suppressor protein
MMTRTHSAVSASSRRDLAERLREFHAALEQQRQFRLEQLQELAEAATNSKPAVDNVNDEVGEILKVGAMTALADVEDALDRLRAGTYGDCAQCTQPISCERLEILPMSRYCMRCQHAREMRRV